MDHDPDLHNEPELYSEAQDNINTNGIGSQKQPTVNKEL